MAEPKVGDYVDVEFDGSSLQNCKIIILDQNTVKIIVPNDFTRGSLFDNFHLDRYKDLKYIIIDNPESYFGERTLWINFLLKGDCYGVDYF